RRTENAGLGILETRALFVAGCTQRTNDAKADVLGIGQIPPTLGNLRVALIPIGFGGEPGSTAQATCRTPPTAAADHVCPTIGATRLVAQWLHVGVAALCWAVNFLVGI